MGSYRFPLCISWPCISGCHHIFKHHCVSWHNEWVAVQASQAIFFPEKSKGSITSVIMAWLNLDVGIKVCSFDGMDTYVKTWLQPVFPIYIWTMVVVIILSSHYSTRVAKLCGRNAVSVLATLFLLSYVKMLRTFVSALSFTVIDYPDGQKIKVWLYDGNVHYMQGNTSFC